MSTRRRRLRSCKWLLRPASLPLRWVFQHSGWIFWTVMPLERPDPDSSLVYLVKKSIKKHDFNTCVNHSVNLVQIKCRPDLVYHWDVTRCDPSEPFVLAIMFFFHLKFLGWYCHFGLGSWCPILKPTEIWIQDWMQAMDFAEQMINVTAIEDILATLA